MRNRLVAMLPLAALALAPAAHAQRLAPIKAGKLAQLCSAERTRTACDAYISGVGDGIAGIEHSMNKAQGTSLAGAICIPSDTSAETLRSTLLDYMRAHRDQADRLAGVATYEALHDAFPCKGQNG